MLWAPREIYREIIQRAPSRVGCIEKTAAKHPDHLCVCVWLCVRKKFHHSRPTFALWLAVEKTWRPFDPALPCSKPHTHTHTHTLCDQAGVGKCNLCQLCIYYICTNSSFPYALPSLLHDFRGSLEQDCHSTIRNSNNYTYACYYTQLLWCVALFQQAFAFACANTHFDVFACLQFLQMSVENNRQWKLN